MPNEAVQFLSLDEASEIHQRLVDAFGGVPGLRDKGLLESALFSPQTHGFFACEVFLRLNGWKLAVEANAGYEFIIWSLEQNKCDYEHLVPWIQRHLKKL